MLTIYFLLDPFLFKFLGRFLLLLLLLLMMVYLLSQVMFWIHYNHMISLSHSSIDFSSFLVNSLIHILIILVLLMMMSICILILISIGLFMGLLLFLMMITINIILLRDFIAVTNFDLIHNGTIKCWILCGQIFQILQNINQF